MSLRFIRSPHRTWMMRDARNVELTKSFGRSVAIDLSIEIVGGNVRKRKDVEGLVALIPS
jgi:hypothetical protein